jgi:hypothetical protein
MAGQLHYRLIFFVPSQRLQLRTLVNYTALISYIRTRSHCCVVFLTYNVTSLVS